MRDRRQEKAYFVCIKSPPLLFLAYLQTAVTVDKSGPLGSHVIPEIAVAAGTLEATEQVILDSGCGGGNKRSRCQVSCNVMVVVAPMAASSATGTAAGSPGQ